MFSYFTNRSQNKPIGALTLQELHKQLVNPDRVPFTRAVNVIPRLRAATDKVEQGKIKGELPAITPGAMLDTKAKDATPDQKNIRLSGFMQVDIDPQDNPNLKDADAIRDKLATIPYIALAAISARGKGVWGLVALAEPDKFLQYIDQVHDYFKAARINIDITKSKNPTELRYFAPDPGAILKHDYLQMPLIPPPQKKVYQKQHYQQATGSTFAELQKWVTDQTGFSLIDGQKHYYLFWLSYALRKNGTSEPDVYSAIHSIYPENKIHSNCISGGINHANTKGIYTPQQRISATQSPVKCDIPAAGDNALQATGTRTEPITPPQLTTASQLIIEGQEKGEIASQQSFRGNQHEDSTTEVRSKTLSDLGISRKESSTPPQAEPTPPEIWQIIEQQFTGRLNPAEWLQIGKTSDEIYYDLTVLAADCLINYGIDVTPDQYYRALRWKENAVNNSNNTAT